MTRSVVRYDTSVTSKDPQQQRKSDLVAAAITRARIATIDDNSAILELLADVPMQGNLALATRRDPDFFALYELQRGRNVLWVDDAADGRLAGMGGILVRDGFLDDKAVPVGYLGDLRTRGFVRERLAFPHVYAHLFHRAVQDTGCEHYLTAILADNAAAAKALTSLSASSSSSSSKKKRRPQPHYHLLTAFHMVNVHFLRKRTVKPTPGLSVRRAVVDDLPAITALLAADHAKRPFGWRFDDGEFEHRLAQWPGFTLNDTFLVHDDNGVLRGVCTCWDASPVKRYRVLRYGGQMLWVKRGLSLLSSLTGTAPLPAVGHDFRYFYLSNLSIVNDDPRVFQALVDAVYAAHADCGFHFFAFPLYPNDPLAAGTRGYFVRRVPFHLHAVTSSSRRRSDWPAGRPGFEMALA